MKKKIMRKSLMHTLTLCSSLCECSYKWVGRRNCQWQWTVSLALACEKKMCELFTVVLLFAALQIFYLQWEMSWFLSWWDFFSKLFSVEWVVVDEKKIDGIDYCLNVFFLRLKGDNDTYCITIVCAEKL